MNTDHANPRSPASPAEHARAANLSKSDRPGEGHAKPRSHTAVDNAESHESGRGERGGREGLGGRGEGKREGGEGGAAAAGGAAFTLPRACTIVLLGLRGSGKTTIGRKLARAFSMPFVDLDELTPHESGCASVAEAFEKLGEAEFRRAESAALAKALRGPSGVLSLGGGTPTAPGAADMLSDARAKGTVVLVYLHASPRLLRSRLKNSDNTNRPALTSKGTVDEVGDVYAARDPVYRKLASAKGGLIVQLAGASPARLVKQIGDGVLIALRPTDARTPESLSARAKPRSH